MSIPTTIRNQIELYKRNPDKNIWMEIDLYMKQTGLPPAHVITDSNGRKLELFNYNNTTIPSALGLIPPDIWWSEENGNVRPVIIEEPMEQRKLIDDYDKMEKLCSTKLPGVPDRVEGKPNMMLDEHAILKHGVCAIPVLFYHMLHNRDIIVSDNIERILTKMDCYLIRSIAAHYLDKIECNRDSCIFVLSNVKATEHFDKIIKQLSDRQLQDSLLFSLGTFGDKRGIPYLIQYLGIEDNGFEAASSLGRLGHYEISIPLLLNLLDTAPDPVRLDASYALFSIATRFKNIPVSNILNHLQDSLPKIRERTANTLREIGDPTALPALKKAARDKNKDVREAVAYAILVLTGGG
jgi:hypothetical protein